MAEVTIGDVTGTAQVRVDNSSLAGKSELSSVLSNTTKFAKDLLQGIDQVDFQSATLSATFKSPIMPRGSLKVEERSMPYYYATASRRAADFDPWRIASKAHRSR